MRAKLCIPPKRNRNILIPPHDPLFYVQRHTIENISGKVKDWTCIHARTINTPTPSPLPFASPTAIVNEGPLRTSKYIGKIPYIVNLVLLRSHKK